MFGPAQYSAGLDFLHYTRTMDSAEEFLSQAHRFQLGDLETEARHPLTTGLSEWAKHDVERAVRALTMVDVQALSQLRTLLPGALALREAVQSTLASGHRVFLCGCGATGRLSLLLEKIWCDRFASVDARFRADQVVGFMAGGDVALVHSLEGFEDHPDRAARHLRQLGFVEGDLLLGITEGGETPFVIGGVLESLALGGRAPWFLYCNPDSILRAKVERSRQIIDHPGIRKLNLSVGPMGLSGSTRMQASTVLQLAAGFALFADITVEEFTAQLEHISESLTGNAGVFLPDFVVRESEIYQGRGYIMYQPTSHHISVFTDTTERAPTFSLTPFAHPFATRILERPPSLCYVHIPGANTSDEAWVALLGREPRPLNWMEVDQRTSAGYLRSFDFGPGALTFRHDQLRRGQLQGQQEEEIFHIGIAPDKSSDQIQWSLTAHERALLVGRALHPLFQHTLLKMLLNIHSTLVMGRLGRFQQNVMTFVHPTNGKLVDRATRYVLALLHDRGVNPLPAYDKVVREVFRQLKADSVVMGAVKALSEKN
jgi:N-acetylmuramic acid 6-phosphate etherase